MAIKFLPTLISLALCLAAPASTAAAELKPETLKAWDNYVQLTEKRIAAELDRTSGFLRTDISKLKNGQIPIERLLTKGADGRELRVPGGLIHHWFGAIFVPDVNLETVLRFVRDYDQHHRRFKEVEQSKLVSREGATYKIFLRFVRTKVVTVHYNTDHTVVYRSHAAGRESSRSFTTRIAQLDDPGTASEKEKPVGNDSGYLWRLNSYWRFQEQDGGVVIECESVSLSRSIPFGFGWLIKRFVESVPRESVESTLASIREGIAKPDGGSSSGQPKR
jgi:hypothetical protein